MNIDPIGWVYQHEETGRMTFCENDGINTPEVFQKLNPRFVLCGAAYPEAAPLSWPEVFRTLKPGTRVRARNEGDDRFYNDFSEGVILTHADDGTTLVAFDTPNKSIASTTKPANAWWTETKLMEVL